MGVVLPTSEPSPSCPLLLSPQQATSPESKSAQLWNSPPWTVESNWLGSSGTETGEFEFPLPPFPNCPYALYPQQNMAPSFTPMQVCIAPASSETALLLLGIEISNGVLLSALVPSPICPFQLSPQHITVLFDVIAQV